MRDRSKEINMLEETLQIFSQGWYKKNGKKVQLKLSAEEMKEIHVFLPEDVEKSCSDLEFNIPYVIGRCGHSCENTDSFTMARERLGKSFQFDKEKRGILVLNFANPVHPGGGVRKGARAQEEDLCRKSSLLLSLESKNAERYYNYNKGLNAEQYAAENNVPIKIFPAEWKKYGKAAGPIRNKAMLDYAKDETPVVAAFWDGKSRGTGNMLKQAKEAGAECHIFLYGFGENVLKSAHEASRFNRALLEKDTKCGCFYCLEVYSPTEIKEWCAEMKDGEEVTAICPYCDIDSVLAESSGYPLTKEFLEAMYKRWFT